MPQIKNYSVDTAVKEYSTSGLTNAQVKQRLNQFGENIFAKEQTSALRTLLRQIIDPLSFILLFAASLSLYMRQYSDAIVILSIVIINTTLGFIQEFRSEKAIQKLSNLIKRKVMVIRDDKQSLIDVARLVPGDTIILRGGDVVPADIKIMEAVNLSVNESQLTGESVPINKRVAGRDARVSQLFTGSVIERGFCQGVIYATGNRTELGKIALLSKNTKKVTPYQKSLSEFSFSILKIIGVTIILMLVIKSFTTQTDGFAAVILFTIALAMTVVPEALPVITTVSLSNGALQLAKHKVVVKRLSAIESLGRINILCTDKTGTLTQDQLFITEIVSDDEVFFQKIAYATIEDLHVKGTKHFNSFDRAFIAHVPSKLQSQVEDWEQLSALPFDPSARRRRVILHSPKTDETYLVTIGSTEAILGLSQVKTRRDYRQLAKQAGQEGKRQLAIAYKLIKYTPDFDILRNESGMTFLGFASLIDPLRPTAKATIALAKELGVEVKILTGDSPEVAACIGRQVGLLGDKGKVYTGTELDRMTAAEFDAAIIASDVFARVTPEQKYHIIKQLKLNNVVGYQGDGINDAPSLKLADASIAVKNASDVAKYSADIILSESDLSVIINGIHYGRSIFININKYIRHAMTGNIGNFFSLTFFYVVFSTNLPLLPIQLLVANLLQDMPLATIFSDRVDEAEVDKPLVASHVKSVVRTSMILGTFTAIFYFVFFMFIGTTATDLTRTSLFLFFNLTQLLVIISVRRKGFFWRGAKPSKPLLIATLLFIASSVAIIYVPSIAQFFSFVPLSLPTLALLFVTAAAFLFLLDLTKVGMYKVYDLYQQRKVTPIVSQ